MFRFSAKSMMIAGGILLVLSVIIPGLLLADILLGWLWSVFVSYMCWLCGVVFGLMGVFTFAKMSRDEHAERAQSEKLWDKNDES